MKDIINEVNSPLFDGINLEDRKTMLGCIGYHIGAFQKGDIVAFEGENIRHIGILLFRTLFISQPRFRLVVSS